MWVYTSRSWFLFHIFISQNCENYNILCIYYLYLALFSLHWEQTSLPVKNHENMITKVLKSLCSFSKQVFCKMTCCPMVLCKCTRTRSRESLRWEVIWFTVLMCLVSFGSIKLIRKCFLGSNEVFSHRLHVKVVQWSWWGSLTLGVTESGTETGATGLNSSVLINISL